MFIVHISRHCQWEMRKEEKKKNLCLISPGCSLEGMMLKLKLQYFGYLMRRVDSLENTLMLGGIGGRRRRRRQRMRWWMASPIRWTWVWVNSGRWWWTGRPGVLWFMGLKRVGYDWATELNWTENEYSSQKYTSVPPTTHSNFFLRLYSFSSFFFSFLFLFNHCPLAHLLFFPFCLSLMSCLFFLFESG